MFSLAVVKKSAIFRRIRLDQGFTLLELLVAMFILTLIVFAFTPLLAGSIERIYFAGDKSEALAQGQEEMEARIVTRETVGGTDLEFIFGDTVVTVPGGLIEVVESAGGAEAWISTFLPYVPFIKLSQDFLVEGYDSEWPEELAIVVMGRDTRFVQTGPVKIYTREGFESPDLPGSYTIVNYVSLTVPPPGLPADFSQYAQFDLPTGLTNAHSPYVVEMSWTVDQVEVKVRTRLHITLPLAVAVGEGGEILVSPDAHRTWSSRPSTIPPGVNLNDIIWADLKYIAAAGNGEVIIWENQKSPQRITIPGLNGRSLNSLAYGDGTLVAVGNDGTIAVSGDGRTWVLKQTGERYNLHAVGWSGSEFLAAGSDGTILKLNRDGSINTAVQMPSIDSGVTFHDLAFGAGAWVAVGETGDGAVIYRESGSGWSPVYSSLDDLALYALAHNGVKFLAAGEGGLIMESTDGQTWISSSLPDHGGNSFYDLVWDGFWNTEHIFIVVGQGGRIYTGNVAGWTKQITGSVSTLKGVAFRWQE